jgi:membrane-bound serine protease (ClpP class)
MNDRVARRNRRFSLCLAGVGLVLVAAAPAVGASRVVHVLPTTGVVDSVMAGYLSEGIAKAAREGDAAIVIELDTPGGSLEATNRIVSALLESPIPTIVWVAPAGGRAASAGTFITLAGHVAAMAPGTSIGAASPVGSGGEDLTGTIGQKVRNDAVAKITAIAEERGRDVEWARRTVTEAWSSPASEAVAVGAVDFIAASLPEVLEKASGRTVTVAGQPVTLDLVGAATPDLPMNPFQQLLHLLSDPTIALILFTVGFYGLLFELQNPNFVTGILGALAIILAFIGFGSLPLNVAGLILIGLAVVLLVLEATVASHGLLTVGALVTFVLGAAALYTEPGSPTLPAVTVSWPTVGILAGSAAVFGLLVARAAVGTRRLPLVAIGSGTGSAGDATVVAPGAGSVGLVHASLAPSGTVVVASEEWSARSASGASIGRGEPVLVVGREGLTLLVEATPDPRRGADAGVVARTASGSPPGAAALG